MTSFLPDYISFAIGLALLLGSAELLVRSSTKMASLIGKSSMFIGLTVTAFGTSAPELAVGISGQLSRSGDVGLGNIIGSNIFNVFFVLGLAAVIRPIVVRRPVIWRDVPILLVVCILFLLCALDGTVGAAESILLVSALAAYVYYLSRHSGERPDISRKPSQMFAGGRASGSLFLTLFQIVVSLAAMVAGARLIVQGAVSMASNLGVSELFSGLTIVAVGTSLPEIATTVAAVRKNEHELAIGNVMGSCFFNVVAVPAAMALIGSSGLAVGKAALTIDIPVMILAIIACLPIFFTGHRISRYEGVLFIVYYFIYFLSLYSRSAPDSLLNRYQTETFAFGIVVVSVTIVVVSIRAVLYHRQHKKEMSS